MVDELEAKVPGAIEVFPVDRNLARIGHGSGGNQGGRQKAEGGKEKKKRGLDGAAKLKDVAGNLGFRTVPPALDRGVHVRRVGSWIEPLGFLWLE